MSEDVARMETLALWDAAVQGWKDEGWNVEELSGLRFKLIYQNFSDICVMVAFRDGLYHIQTEYKGRGVKKSDEYGEDDSRPWSEALDEPYAKLPAGKLADELKANRDFQQYVIGRVNELKGLLATFYRSNAWRTAVGPHKNWKIWIWQLYVLACDLALPEEGKPFMDIFEDKENGNFVIKLSNRTHDAGLLKKTLTRIGLADMEIRDDCSVRLDVVPPSEACAVPERVKHWIERLKDGVDDSSFSLMVDYPDICEVVFEEGRIKVKSNAGWKEDLRLDEITAKLSRLAEGHSLPLSGCTDCLMSYDCWSTDQQENDRKARIAESIFAELPSPDELEAKWAASDEKHEESADGRVFEVLPEVKAWTLAEIFKWKLNLPAYQRPYVWQQGNADTLWSDISEFKESEEESKKSEGYDFGMIVLHKKAGSYDIVDGQQRLVTLALMLTALDSSAAASFIKHVNLQGAASGKNVASNLRRLMRKAMRLAGKNGKEAMASKILAAKADVVVMDDIDETLKFFNRMNTAGRELSKLDILKSHHLLALADDKQLSGEAKERVKERWQKLRDRAEAWHDPRGFIPPECLDSPTEFRREVVKAWESYRSDWLRWQLSRACAIRMMARWKRPGNLDDVINRDKNFEDFRGGNNPDGVYTGLDCPIQDGEFFFWYVFNLRGIYDKVGRDKDLLYKERIISESENYDAHMTRLRRLLRHVNDWSQKKEFEEFFVLLVIYLHEKFPEEVNTEKFNKVIDILFSWLAWLYLTYPPNYFQFNNPINNYVIKKNSPFMAIVSSKTLDDCFECDLENPLDFLGYAGGNGKNYLIRRELRRIWQDLFL